MYLLEHVTSVILAAGKGSRFGSDIPKQFHEINGKSVLETSIEKFNNNKFVDNIIVVLNQNYEDYDELSVKLITNYPKVQTIVPGGRERQDSVNNSLKYVGNGIVLIHDAARPFVTDDIINSVIISSSKKGTGIPVVNVKDTVRTEGETLDRSKLYQVQTPQGFKTKILKDAYEKAYNDSFYGTDDASLVERIGVELNLVDGDYENIKITTKGDLKEEQTFDIRFGIGYDVHRLVEGRRLILCGVEVPYKLGLLGHSDADVALHALMDAMLGCLALGDIGKLFPDNDPKYEGASSLYLLSKVNELILERGYVVNNIDINIICEKPKLREYIDSMREMVAGTLSIDKSLCSIKATTEEGLGFTGNGLGISSQAICSIRKK